MSSEYKSRVYTERPSYADAETPDKFQAIQGIIASARRDTIPESDLQLFGRS